MALTINGTVWADGKPLTVGGVQVQGVTANGVNVWRNNYAPTVPPGFTASTNLDGKIEFNWALPIDQGVPVCTYKVWVAEPYMSELIATAGAGATTVTVTLATQGTDYFVQATNIVGVGNSGRSTGISQEPAGSQTFTSSGTFVKKRGWSSYTAVLSGGAGGGGGGGGGGASVGGTGGAGGASAGGTGGDGGASSVKGGSGGGGGGYPTTTTTTVTLTENTPVTIGGGGTGGAGSINGSGGAGVAGGTTSFATASSVGGTGGGGGASYGGAGGAGGTVGGTAGTAGIAGASAKGGAGGVGTGSKAVISWG